MANKQMTADEKRWRAETDADAMARYEEIMQDKSRRDAATKVARERAADLTKRANIMSRVATGKSESRPRTAKPKSKK